MMKSASQLGDEVLRKFAAFAMSADVKEKESPMPPPVEGIRTIRAEIPPPYIQKPQATKASRPPKPAKAPPLEKSVAKPPGTPADSPREQRQTAVEYFNTRTASIADGVLSKIALSLSTVEAARNARLEQIYKGLTGRPNSRFDESQAPDKVRDLLQSLVRLDQQGPRSAKVMSGAGLVEQGHGVPGNVSSAQLMRLSRDVPELGFHYV
jgi:hypothetical protein